MQAKQYIDLELAKKQLNIEEDFQDDDLYIYGLISVCQDAVEKHLDIKLESLEDEDGNLPTPIIHAMLLLLSTFYATRESISSAAMHPVPHAFDYLCDLYQNYDYKDAIYKNISSN